jgi:signal transduction histidine kinase
MNAGRVQWRERLGNARRWIMDQIPSGRDEPDVFKRKLLNFINIFVLCSMNIFVFGEYWPRGADGLLLRGYSYMAAKYGLVWVEIFWRECVGYLWVSISAGIILALNRQRKVSYNILASLTVISFLVSLLVSIRPLDLLQSSMLFWMMPLAMATLLLPSWTIYVVAGVESVILNYYLDIYQSDLGSSYDYAWAYITLGLFFAASFYWLTMTIANNAINNLRYEVHTSRRHAEDADHLRKRILGIVSHEMRTPINVIEMSAEAVLLGAFPKEEDRELVLRQIVSGSRQLGQLVEDLLDQTRLDTDSLVLRSRAFRVREELLEPVLERYRPRAEAGGLELSGHVAEDLPDVMVGDVNRLAQVLGNLVENAVKFTRSGSVRVDVVREGEQWGFDVVDTGIGIAAQEIDEIWKSFRMVDDSRARLDQHGGLGLGLAIVSGLVAAMGGTRAVESELGRGSTFRVRLPLVKAEDEA